MASPSRITERSGRARTASTISGMRSPTGSSVRVKTATSSPSRCTWMRTPSSFHSTAAGVDLLKRGLERRRGLREHRLDGPPDLQMERAEPRGALA